MTLELPERPLHPGEIELPLRIDVAHDFGRPQRELAPLALLTFINERAHLGEQLRVRRGGRRRRDVRTLRHLRPEPLLERGEVGLRHGGGD